MNVKRKIEDLGAHYKVARGSHNYRQWSDAIKLAAKATDKSIEVLWDEVQAAKTARVESPATEILPPESLPEHDVSPSVDTVHEGRVAIHVHSPQALPAQVVEYPPRDLIGFATRVAAGCQTLALGLVMGVLISKPVLKFLGY